MPIAEARLLQFPLSLGKKTLKVNDFRLTLWGGSLRSMRQKRRGTWEERVIRTDFKSGYGDFELDGRDISYVCHTIT